MSEMFPFLTNNCYKIKNYVFRLYQMEILQNVKNKMYTLSIRQSFKYNYNGGEGRYVSSPKDDALSTVIEKVKGEEKMCLRSIPNLYGSLNKEWVLILYTVLHKVTLKLQAYVMFFDKQFV